MKPGMTVFRGLFALLPLLGLALAGCGNAVGSLEQTGAASEWPPAEITITGRASMPRQALIPAPAADAPILNGTVRVRRYTSSGQAVDVTLLGGSVSTTSDGTYRAVVEMDSDARSALWEVEVFGTVTGLPQPVLLLSCFVPGPSASPERNVNIDLASTLVALTLGRAAGTRGTTGTLANDQVARTTSLVGTTLAETGYLDRVYGTYVPANVLPVGPNSQAAYARLSGDELPKLVAAACGSLIRSVQIWESTEYLSVPGVVAGQPPLPLATGAPTADGQWASTQRTAGAMELPTGIGSTLRTLSLTGCALDSGGNPLALGLEFVVERQTPTGVVSIAQLTANQSQVTGNGPAGEAWLIARLAIPGQSATTDRTAGLHLIVP